MELGGDVFAAVFSPIFEHFLHFQKTGNSISTWRCLVQTLDPAGSTHHAITGYYTRYYLQTGIFVGADGRKLTMFRMIAGRRAVSLGRRSDTWSDSQPELRVAWCLRFGGILFESYCVDYGGTCNNFM